MTVVILKKGQQADAALLSVRQSERLAFSLSREIKIITTNKKKKEHPSPNKNYNTTTNNNNELWLEHHCHIHHSFFVLFLAGAFLLGSKKSRPTHAQILDVLFDV